MNQQLSGGPQPTGPDNPEVSWWCRLLARVVGTVGALVAMITGIFTCMSLHAMCIIAGVIQIVAGAIVLVFEAPICCTFLDITRPIATFAENRTFFQKAIIFCLFSIPPVAMCFGLTTLFGCALMFASGVLYGLMGLGRKCMREHWAGKQRDRAAGWWQKRRPPGGQGDGSVGASTLDLLNEMDRSASCASFGADSAVQTPQDAVNHRIPTAGPAVVLQFVSAETAVRTAGMADTSATITTATVSSTEHNSKTLLELANSHESPRKSATKSPKRDRKRSPSKDAVVMAKDSSTSTQSSGSRRRHSKSPVSKSKSRRSRHNSRSRRKSRSKSKTLEVYEAEDCDILDDAEILHTVYGSLENPLFRKTSWSPNASPVMSGGNGSQRRSKTVEAQDRQAKEVPDEADYEVLTNSTARKTKRKKRSSHKH